MTPLRKIYTNGYLSLGTVKDVSVLAHWSVLPGAFVLGGFKFVPYFWLAYVFVVLCHEVGHALMVLLCRAEVARIELDGAGGKCIWSGQVSRMQESVIAWGGVLAQGVLWILTALVLYYAPSISDSKVGTQVTSAFLRLNLILIAFNLIPAKSLDGAKAWPLVFMMVRPLSKRLEPITRMAKRHLLRLRTGRIDRQVAQGNIDPAVQQQLDNILKQGKRNTGNVPIEED